MSRRDFSNQVECLVGEAPTGIQALAGGCIAEVYRLDFSSHDPLVAKVSASGGLEPEAWMLRFLGAESSLPVPSVVHGADDLLLMTYIANDGGTLGAQALSDAADHLARLHEVSAPRFGLSRSTLIGSLDQPNDPSDRWIEFFRDQRLVGFSRRALEQGTLDHSTMERVERLAARLDEWLEEPARPSLIHGDMWTGNVLVNEGRISGFVDPAIYFADAEIELAFSTLFGTFSDIFFSRYAEHRPIRDGFFEARRDIYNLYPLLVHAILFGGSYAAGVDRTLRHFVG